MTPSGRKTYRLHILARVLAWKYLIAVAVIFGCAVFVSHQYQRSRRQCAEKCEQGNPFPGTRSSATKSCDQCEQVAERYLPRWYRLFAWPEGVTTWAVLLTLLAIAEQTYHTRRAAEATESSVRASDKAYSLAENTAKQQLRAYVVARNSHLVIHDDGFVEPKIELTNCGQTPAYDVRGGTICRFTVYPVPPPKPMPDDLRMSRTTLGAGHGFWLLPPGGRHNHGDREHIIAKLSSKDGTLVYCATGYYTYRDIFKDSHWIKFQLIVGGPSGFRQSVEEGKLRASFSPDCVGNEED